MRNKVPGGSSIPRHHATPALGQFHPTSLCCPITRAVPPHGHHATPSPGQLHPASPCRPSTGAVPPCITMPPHHWGSSIPWHHAAPPPGQFHPAPPCRPSTHVHACYHFSRVRLFATVRTVARQISLSVGFSRQQYWSGLPWPSPGDLPDPGIKPVSLSSTCIGRWVLYH